MNSNQNKRNGMVKIGEWGYADFRGAGDIYCLPEHRYAVQAAYDAIEDGDTRSDVLSEVFAAGGVFVAD